MADKQKYLNWLDEHAGLFADVSDSIWEYAELSLMEEKSCALYVKLLREEGFTVETPVANIQTGFKATIRLIENSQSTLNVGRRQPDLP